MKPPSKRTWGVILIVSSILAMAVGVCQVIPYAYVDYPCEYNEIVPSLLEINSNTRIVYCISVYPLEAVSGGGIYDVGSTDQNGIAAREINLRRDGQTLFVNNHSLKQSEVYRTVRWTPSLNPWIIYTRRFEIRNDGISPSAPTDILQVSGNVYEGWTINPLGPVILGIGIWLFWKGMKEQEQASKNRSMEQAQPIQQNEMEQFIAPAEMEKRRAERLGVEVVVCPNCGTINSLAFLNCEKCETKLEKVKPVRNPYL